LKKKEKQQKKLRLKKQNINYKSFYKWILIIILRPKN
jgi:hypothetical protein